MKDRRTGKIYIQTPDSNCVTSDIVGMLKLLDFFPYRVEHLYYRNEFEFIGSSPLFDELSIGEEAPEYRITMHKDENDVLSLVSVDRVDR